MKAKMIVTQISENYSGAKLTELSAVNSGTPEDNYFFKATPFASLKIQVDNPAAKDFLKIGKKYYIEFSEAAE